MYVLRLADMIADREELDLQVQVCTSFEQEERLEEFQEAELLLIGDEIPYEKRQTSRAARRFVLGVLKEIVGSFDLLPDKCNLRYKIRIRTSEINIGFIMVIRVCWHDIPSFLKL